MSFVTVEKPRPHVSVITLRRPERMNALSFELVEPLYRAVDGVGRDNDTWVVVLTGEGRGFCAGLDLEDHGVPPNVDGLPMSRIATRAMAYMSELVPALRRMPLWSSRRRLVVADRLPSGARRQLPSFWSASSAVCWPGRILGLMTPGSRIGRHMVIRRSPPRACRAAGARRIKRGKSTAIRRETLPW